MEDKILTITIPSYNVEAYLEDCLESFVNSEVMDDIEVLIVNDGSSDRTEEIARRYESKYPNTYRLINKENGGHGSTINTGAAEAKGKYFKVVDGDDWVDTRSFIHLVKVLKKIDADIVASNYTWINHTTKMPEERQEHPFEKIEYNRMYNFEEIVVSDKLIKKILHYLTCKFGIVVITSNLQNDLLGFLKNVETKEYLEKKFTRLYIQDLKNYMRRKLVSSVLYR